MNRLSLWLMELLLRASLAESDCAVVGAIGVLQSHVPQQSHGPPQQQMMGTFHYSAFNAAAQVPQMDALEMQLASMQGMPGYGKIHIIIPHGCCARCDEHHHGPAPDREQAELQVLETTALLPFLQVSTTLTHAGAVLCLDMAMCAMQREQRFKSSRSRAPWGVAH